MGSVICSTTVTAWKSSTTPLSVSYLASRFRSWPKCFLAAVCIASSRVATSTLLSMPLSLATCSRTRLRLTDGVLGVAIGGSVSYQGRCLSELEVEVRLGDVAEGDLECPTALDLHSDVGRAHLLEDTGKTLPRRASDGT